MREMEHFLFNTTQSGCSNPQVYPILISHQNNIQPRQPIIHISPYSRGISAYNVGGDILLLTVIPWIDAINSPEGKSVILHIIRGVRFISMHLKGRECTLHSPNDEAIGLVFQSFDIRNTQALQLDRVGLFGCLVTDSIYNIVGAFPVLVTSSRLKESYFSSSI